MKKSTAILLRLYGLVVGVAFGLFISLVVFSLIFRVLIYFLLGYGDSGPEWLGALEISSTIMIFLGCVWASDKWMKGYIEKRRMSGSKA